MFKRWHYEAVAEALKQARLNRAGGTSYEDALHVVRIKLSDMFHADSPRFDLMRFDQAINNGEGSDDTQREHLIRLILNGQGFTVNANLEDYNVKQGGFAVSVPDFEINIPTAALLTREVVNSVIDAYLRLILSEDWFDFGAIYFGGWCDDDGHYIFDITTIEPLFEDAYGLAQDREQKTFFDIDANESITVKGCV